VADREEASDRLVLRDPLPEFEWALARAIMSPQKSIPRQHHLTLKRSRRLGKLGFPGDCFSAWPNRPVTLAPSLPRGGQRGSPSECLQRHFSEVDQLPALLRTADAPEGQGIVGA
jgi:hypothetical protein